MNRVNLEKSKQTCLQFSFVPGVMGPDGDVLFQEFTRFGATFPLEGEFFPVLFERLVDGNGADGQEPVPDIRGDMERRSHLKEGHLVPDEGGQALPAPVPEEGPDTP
jgi:hypothetical protein